MKSGIERIAAERKRQIEQEGWTPEHDDQYKRRELGLAALCYVGMADFLCTAPSGEARNFMAEESADCPPEFWPGPVEWWKPSADPIRNLEKAGALIAAQIDRLERMEQTKS